jgi:hypothetical protein
VRVLAAVAAGVAIGAVAALALEHVVENETTASPEVVAEGTLSTLPRAPVTVRAETVVLPAGFESRHFHGGPTFNLVEAGSVAITDEAGRVVYDADSFFFEPARHPHTIPVLEDATLRVVRLLPPGASATTELPE